MTMLMFNRCNVFHVHHFTGSFACQHALISTEFFFNGIWSDDGLK